MSETIYFTNVRLSFPSLTEARASTEGAVPKFNASFLIDPSNPSIAEFMTQYGVLAQEKWKESAGNIMQMIQADRRLRCYGNGEENVNKKTFQPYDGYAGKFVIAANRDTMPQMIKADGNGVDPSNTMEAQQIARAMYAGCYVNVALRPWLQDNAHGRGVRCDLVAIQFNSDGEAFGEGIQDASGMFGQAATPVAGVATPAGMPVPPVAGQVSPVPPVQQAPIQPATPPGMPGLPDFMGGQ